MSEECNLAHVIELFMNDGPLNSRQQEALRCLRDGRPQDAYGALGNFGCQGSIVWRMQWEDRRHFPMEQASVDELRKLESLYRIQNACWVRVD